MTVWLPFVPLKTLLLTKWAVWSGPHQWWRTDASSFARPWRKITTTSLQWQSIHAQNDKTFSLEGNLAKGGGWGPVISCLKWEKEK